MVAFFHGETCFFSLKHLDLLTGVFEINSKIRKSHFLFLQTKNMEGRYRKKFAKVKNALKRIFPMSEICWKINSWDYKRIQTDVEATFITGIFLVSVKNFLLLIWSFVKFWFKYWTTRNVDSCHMTGRYFFICCWFILDKKNTIYLTVKIADGVIDTFQCFCHALFSSFECRPLISAVPQVMKYCTNSNWCMFLILVFEMNLIQKVPKSPTWLNATIICKFNRKK